MGVFKNIVKGSIMGYEQGANYQLGHSIASNAVTNILGGTDEINVLKEYLGFAWKCINVRAEAIASEQLFVERQVNGKWQREDNHDFNKVLNGTEDGMDLYELIYAHSVSLDMYGESFWYFSKGSQSGKPQQVYILDPNWVTVYVLNQRITGYVYTFNGANIVLDVDEVAHYRIYDPNPWRKFRGVGPMQAAGWFVKSGRYVNTYVNSFMENNAIPAGVVVSEGQVDNNDWELFKNQWAERYSGAANAGKTGFIRGSKLSFVKTGLSLGEADFEKLKTTSRDEILAMFSVPGPLLGIYENSNRASAMVAKGMFATGFTEPALKRIQSKLTRKLQNWYGSQFRLGFTNPVPEDTDQQLALYKEGTNKWFTANEARSVYGYDPIPGGDQLYITNTQLPVSAPQKKELGKITIRAKSRGFSYEMKESFRSKTEEIQHKYELKFLEAANPVLEAQKKMVLDQLQPKKIADTNFNIQDQAQNLSDAVSEIMLALALEQGNISLAFVAGEDATFTLTEVQKKYIHDSIAKACEGFTEDTQAQIAKAVADGLANGDSITEISKAIDKIYENVLGVKQPGYRIERLSRTEVIKASNAITEAAYQDSGVVEKKEWFANPGACEYCQQLNGSVISLSASYVPLGGKLEGVDGGTRINEYETIDHPPAHPSCRCTIVPVIEKSI